jgi:hypothetical protein
MCLRLVTSRFRDDVESTPAIEIDVMALLASKSLNRAESASVVFALRDR